MKWMRPSPSMVISLIALFVALGGTSYAAINALPTNSVGTKQIKNGAVTGAKLNAAVLKKYYHLGGTLPSGMTEVGDWGFGTTYGGGGADARPVFTFPIPLAAGLDSVHRIAVTGASATHCPGVGHANPGYLCVYENNNTNTVDPNDGNIYNPELFNGPEGTGKYGFAILLSPAGAGDWFISGTYAVTAP